MIEATLCAFEAPQYLFFSSNVPTLLYFSHFPAFFFSLALGLYVLLRTRRKLEAWVLFLSLLPFAIWVFSDLILFASNRSDLVLFFWSLLVLIEPLPHFGLWYLQRLINTGKDLSFKLKLLTLSLFIPLFLIIGTGVGLPAFDVSVCIAVESSYLHYAYILEYSFIFLIIIDTIRFAVSAPDRITRWKILNLSLAILLFLITFSTGNLLGSLSDNWTFAQTGLFGAPIFIGLMVYLLARFKLFNIKVLAAQMLVVVLWGMVFMLLFLRTINSVRIVTTIALILVLVLGFILVRNVKREVQAREEIQRLADTLEKANTRLTELDRQKNQFLSIASHDLRAPLTVIRNFMSLLLDGTYGRLPSAADEGAHQVFDRATDMAKLIDGYLDVSRIEQGKMKYDMAPLDLAKVVAESVDGFKTTAEARNLKLTLHGLTQSIKTKGDATHLREALNLLIDNSIKYTPTGSITVTVEQVGNVARIALTDTGIGMTEDTIKNKLFKLFSTADDSKKTNASSAGVGLYVVKNIIDAHHGTIRAESAGEGKGSTFIVELPL